MDCEADDVEGLEDSEEVLQEKQDVLLCTNGELLVQWGGGKDTESDDNCEDSTESNDEGEKSTFDVTGIDDVSLELGLVLLDGMEDAGGTYDE